MHVFSKIFYAGQFLLTSVFARAQYASFKLVPHNNPLETPVDSMVHHLAEVFFKKAAAPGLVIGTMQNGKRRFYAYGYAVKATKQLFTEHTVLEAGSITKTFVANLLFQLEEEGKVSSGDPVTKYLPGLAVPDSALQKVTLARLANHTSGLPRLPANLDKVPGFEVMQPYKHYRAAHLYEYLQKASFKKGGSYDYSNLGFGLLGTVLENSQQQSLAQLLQQYIFTPLQMHESRLADSTPALPQATGYMNGKAVPFWQFGCLAGAGAIQSTAANMLDYLGAHIGPTGQPLFDAAAATITQKTAVAGMNVDIGYGWHIFNDLKYPLYWHNGGTYGFSTFAAFEPHTQTAVFLAANAFDQNKGLDKMGVDLGLYLLHTP